MTRPKDMGAGSTKATGLIHEAGVADQLKTPAPDEEAWIEVIHKMDDVYADLVRSQVEFEKKNSELEDAHNFIRSVLASMTELLVVCDIEGHIQQTNAAFDELIGKSAADLNGTLAFSLFTEEDGRTMVNEFPEKVRTYRSVVDCEVSITNAAGETLPLAINCSPRYDHKGALVGMVLMGRPLGELRKAYAQLDRAHDILRKTQQQLIFSEKMAALGRLVAGVAHELNNPISFVFGNMHALKRYGTSITRYLAAIDSDMDPHELRNLREELKIDRIVKDISPLVDGTLEGAERVSDIVQDLRRFSGSQTEPRDTFNLAGVARTAAMWVCTTSKSQPVVSFDVPQELYISARKGHIHQIIVNLVQNALDAMAQLREPRLTISCRAHTDGVSLEVRDHGPGIPQDALAHIFEPFFTRKPIGEGTGLGLYVSYTMAEEQGGSLTGDNHPEGGAVFTLRLPAEVLNEQP